MPPNARSNYAISLLVILLTAAPSAGRRRSGHVLPVGTIIAIESAGGKGVEE
jgi:hypothetical protein